MASEQRFTTLKVLAVLLPIHVLGATSAWRDLNRRAADEVRGNKRAWRAASFLNVLGWVAYFVFGRKRV